MGGADIDEDTELAKKTTAKKSAKKTATKKSAKKAAVKKTTTKKSAKKAVVKKTTTKKVAKKAVAKKTAVKKVAKKAVVKKAPVKSAVKTVVKKAAKVKRATTSSYLTKKEIAEFRKLLMEKRQLLLGDLAGIEGNSLGRNLQDSSGDLSTMPTHPADIGSDNYEQEFTLGLLESERALLGEINEALGRLDDNIFGICIGTGKPIGKPRLRARPWCRYSIEYKKLVEKGLIRPGEALGEEG